MCTITYFVAVSLDGRIAGPDHQIDAFGFPAELASHLVEHYPETLPAPARVAMGIDQLPNRRFDTVIMGRETFELGRRDGLTSPYPQLRQIVASTSLERDVDPDIEVVGRLTPEDLEEVLGDGSEEVWLCGGGVLAGALASRIDRLVLKRAPVLLGDGRPLFDGDYAPDTFTLVDRVIAGPVSVETYERA
ncbi:MAG: dihydrofolate reductase family protein [Acidimicrobiales bacterium]